MIFFNVFSPLSLLISLHIHNIKVAVELTSFGNGKYISYMISITVPFNYGCSWLYNILVTLKRE